MNNMPIKLMYLDVIHLMFTIQNHPSVQTSMYCQTTRLDKYDDSE